MVGPQMFWMTPWSYALILCLVGAVPAILAGVQSRIELRAARRSVLCAIGRLQSRSAVSTASQDRRRIDCCRSRPADRTGDRHPAGLVAVSDAADHRSWSDRAVGRRCDQRSVADGSGTVRPVAFTDGTEEGAQCSIHRPGHGAGQNLSLYGYSRPTTPGLERLALEAATFDFAMSTAPWTLKSHGTMFTGLYPEEIEGDFEHPHGVQDSLFLPTNSASGDT